MSNSRLNNQTLNTIKVLWQHKLPPKLIADVLNLKYPLVSLYCRSFKTAFEQHTNQAVVAKILNPHDFHTELFTPEEIINNHLASGE